MSLYLELWFITSFVGLRVPPFQFCNGRADVRRKDLSVTTRQWLQYSIVSKDVLFLQVHAVEITLGKYSSPVTLSRGVLYLEMKLWPEVCSIWKCNMEQVCSAWKCTSHTYHSLHHLHPLLSHLGDGPSNVYHSLFLYLFQNTVYGHVRPSATHTSTAWQKVKVLIWYWIHGDMLRLLYRAVEIILH